jgi:hypothetical protein
MTTFNQYHDYFKAIADSHVDIMAFHFGGVEDILGFERSGIQYPCFWLEPPSVVTNFEQGMISYMGAFAIMSPLEVNDLMTNRLATLQATEAIVHEILGKLRVDWENRVGLVDPSSMHYDMLTGITSDYDWGWRVEFTCNASNPFCHNPLKFQ